MSERTVERARRRARDLPRDLIDQVVGSVAAVGWVLVAGDYPVGLGRAILRSGAKIRSLVILASGNENFARARGLETKRLLSDRWVGQAVNELLSCEVYQYAVQESSLATFGMPFGFDTIYLTPTGRETAAAKHLYRMLADRGKMTVVLGKRESENGRLLAWLDQSRAKRFEGFAVVKK